MRVYLNHENQALAQSVNVWLEPVCLELEKRYDPTFSQIVLYVTSGIVKFEAITREGLRVSQAVGFPAIWTTKADALVRFLCHKLRKKLPYQAPAVWAPDLWFKL